MDDNVPLRRGQQLREAARKRRGPGSMDISNWDHRDIQELVTELQLYQEELTLQNEELDAGRAELVEARDRYRDLYERAPVGYITMADSGRIGEANLRAAELLGTPREGVIGVPLSAFLSPDFQDDYFRHRRALRPDMGRQTAELRLAAGDGPERVVHLETVAEVPPGPDGPRYRTAMIDITARRQAEESLRLERGRLAQRVRELEIFSHSVSHDLRSPLRAIEGYSHILEEDFREQFDEEARGYLRRMRYGVGRMSALLDGLLAVSRVGQREMQIQELDLSALAQEVAGELSASDPGRAVTWRLESGLMAHGDPALLRLMLRNLLANAWKFTCEREDPVIEFGWVGQGDADGSFYVRDNGAGFHMDHAEALFQPFQRLHHFDEYPGTGIGLTTVQHVVERHGGRIWGEGVPDQGATFYFTLPR